MVPLKTASIWSDGKDILRKKTRGSESQILNMLQKLSMPIKPGSKTPSDENPQLESNHPVQARESGCMITASDGHHPIKNLQFSSAYYDKIFTWISGPPRWLIKNLDLTFTPISHNHVYFLRYNPNWEIPEPTSPPKYHCSHSPLSGKQLICTCSCCHYHCPTHSPEYYSYSQ